MTTNYTTKLPNLVGKSWCLIGPSVSARGQLPSLIELNLTFALELDRQLCWIETSMTLRKINIEKSVSNSPVIRTTGATESNLWERFADKTIYCEINCFVMGIENSYCAAYLPKNSPVFTPECVFNTQSAGSNCYGRVLRIAIAQRESERVCPIVPPRVLSTSQQTNYCYYEAKTEIWKTRTKSEKLPFRFHHGWRDLGLSSIDDYDDDDDGDSDGDSDDDDEDASSMMTMTIQVFFPNQN